MPINTEGPTLTSQLSVATSITNQARVVIIDKVNGSFETLTIPASILQNQSNVNISALTNVSIVSPGDSDVLMYSSTKNQWIASTAGYLQGSQNLSDLSDVNAAVANLGVITSTSAVTIMNSLIGNAHLASLKDVKVSSATDLQVLAYASASAKWTNRQLSTSDISGLSVYITSASVATALTPYLTSASAVTYIATQLSAYPLTTSIEQYITSALTPYITSASAATAYGSKITTLASATDVSIGTLVNGHTLLYNTSDNKWYNAPTATGINYLVSALDVSVSSPTIGQLMVFAADSKWHNTTIDYVTSASLATVLTPYITSASAATAYAGKITTLASATDVSINTPTNTQVLAYSTSDNKWHNTTNAAGITAIANATDVSVSSATNGQLLQFQSGDSKWHNVTIDYVTSASLTTLIGPYITSASVVTALGPYITSASAVTLIAPYITSASVLTALGPYITSASAVTLIAPYITSASVATALAPYLTSASAVTLIAPYITSASVLTALGPYITSASITTVLGSYLTSTSALNSLWAAIAYSNLGAF